MSHAVIPSKSRERPPPPSHRLWASYSPARQPVLRPRRQRQRSTWPVVQLGAERVNCIRGPTQDLLGTLPSAAELCGDMAKPKPPLDLASTATSSSSHESASSTTRRRAPYNSPPRPSSNLIALLATVAASSSAADGRPLSPDSRPPDFLCPFLSPRFVPDRPSSSRRTLKVEVAEAAVEEEAEEVYGLSPTPTRLRRVGAAAPNVPDKYVEGDDGRWRKEHSWTLYGSTYCDVSSLHFI